MKLPKETQEFNSWVLGGSYSRTKMKRDQIKADIEQAKKVKEGEELDESDPFQKRLIARRQQHKEDREKPICCFRKPDAGAKAKIASPAPPKRRSSPTRVEEPLEPHADAQHSEPTLRERLHQSFEQTTASHAYGTLFPPLLTPYNRPCNFLRFVERSHSSPPAEPDLGVGQQPIREPPVRETFSLARTERTRPQPRSGPKPFFPTGSSATAYRLLANSAYAARMQPSGTQPHALSASLHSRSLQRTEELSVAGGPPEAQVVAAEPTATTPVTGDESQ